MLENSLVSGLIAFLLSALGQEDLDISQAVALLKTTEAQAYHLQSVSGWWPSDTASKCIRADAIVQRGFCDFLFEPRGGILRGALKMAKSFSLSSAAFKSV